MAFYSYELLTQKVHYNYRQIAVSSCNYWSPSTITNYSSSVYKQGHYNKMQKSKTQLLKRLHQKFCRVSPKNCSIRFFWPSAWVFGTILIWECAGLFRGRFYLCWILKAEGGSSLAVVLGSRHSLFFLPEITNNPDEPSLVIFPPPPGFTFFSKTAKLWR